MPDTHLLRADIRSEQDVVLVRQRARELALLLGFDAQDQTRIATSVSEIARNAYEYAGGGRAAFLVRGARYVMCISDAGPGIADVPAILEGRYESATGMGLGIVGARRLVDHFEIESAPGRGTTVTLAKELPPGNRHLSAERLQDIAQRVLAFSPDDPLAELQARNHELLLALDELRSRQSEIERLNGELTETNRGVLALYAELDDRALQLGRASELKSHFLSSISHELRTPLNAIQNLTRLLLDRLDGGLTAEQERQVTMIRDAASGLTEMVNDLLDLARIEAGKTVLRCSDFAVSDLLSALRGMMRPIVTSDTVTLLVEAPAGEWRMYSDEGKVSQILRNLVGNAVKFTEHGKIRVSASYDPGPDRIAFAVSDTGLGIEPSDLERIFEEYAQVESYLQRSAGGTGLGLPLSRKLAQVLGGSLVAESEPGRGSTFTLTLPCVCPRSDGDDPTAAGPAIAEVQRA